VYLFSEGIESEIEKLDGVSEEVVCLLGVIIRISFFEGMMVLS